MPPSGLHCLRHQELRDRHVLETPRRETSFFWFPFSLILSVCRELSNRGPIAACNWAPSQKQLLHHLPPAYPANVTPPPSLCHPSQQESQKSNNRKYHALVTGQNFARGKTARRHGASSQRVKRQEPRTSGSMEALKNGEVHQAERERENQREKTHTPQGHSREPTAHLIRLLPAT